MQDSITIVISCAGKGTRLQMGNTKALVSILDFPLIWWQLQALKDFTDIRIVVGYQAKDVIDYVKTIRKDILFVFNHEYETTGTAASLSLAVKGAKNLVLSLDGDLLITPDSLKNFINYGEPALGYVSSFTEEPNFAAFNTNTNMIDYFGIPASNSHTKVEWSGLCCLTKEQLEQSIALDVHKNHVYQMIEQHLPLPAISVNAREIDTPKDFEIVSKFLATNKELWSSVE